MVNLLGFNGDEEQLKERLNLLEEIPDLYIHWYEKDSNVPGRKLGHVTYLLNESNLSARQQEAKAFVKEVRSIWPS